jgi:two-component system chemotaxis sensor kinase CheA
MDDLLADFIAEAQDMLGALSGEIVAWEKDPADRARLDSIFRFFHTVKGNCGFFDFPCLEMLSHAAEDVLADVRAGRREADSALVDVVLAVLDRIGAMVADIEAGNAVDETGLDELIARLQDPAHDDPSVDQAAQAPDGCEQGGGEQGGSASGSAGLRKRTVRLPVDLLDRIMSGVSDMVLARNDLARRMQAHDRQTGLEAPFNRLSAILDEVREAITQTRMQSIDTIFTAFPRMVRDLSADLGKQVLVEMENGDVELDRELVEVIRDPLVHVIRNAIDHGIETPAERRAAGKREIGLLRISARQTGNEIRIGVIDDGRGIDGDAVVAKAIASGIVTAEEAERLTPRQRNLLICAPGFSTRDEATAVSGRGVGMDVVRANLEQIGGSLFIDTTPGSGTRILLNVPLTLSIVPSLTVGVAGQKFAMPRSYVEEVVRLDAGDTAQSQVGGVRLVALRGTQVPSVPLASVLGIDPLPGDQPGGQVGGQMMVAIRLVGGDLIGLVVDRVFEHEELVVKPLAPVVMACGYYVGNTQMDDGSPVLMLDVSGIARSAGLIREVERRADAQVVEEDGQHSQRARVPALLFAGIDGARRVVHMQSVDRIAHVPAHAVRLAGRRSQVVFDDVILPLAGVPVGTDLTGRVSVMLLSEGAARIAYAFAEMVDTTAIDADLKPDGAGEAARAIALVDGSPVEVLDCALLFAEAGLATAQPAKPSCRLVGADPWMQDFLRPLVESAGYRLTHDGNADVAIAMAEDVAGVAIAPAGHVIQLRSEPDAAPGSEHSIYRHDTEALRMALLSARMEAAQ